MHRARELLEVNIEPMAQLLDLPSELNPPISPTLTYAPTGEQSASEAANIPAASSRVLAAAPNVVEATLNTLASSDIEEFGIDQITPSWRAKHSGP